MRVRRSAMGSVMLIGAPSPARLGQTRDLPAIRDFADLHPRQTELAVHAARAAGDRAAIAMARGTRIARHRLQLRLRRLPILVRRLGAADELLELGAPLSVLLHDFGAMLLALDHAGFRHSPRKSSFAEWEAERLEKRPPFFVVTCRRGDRDVHAT